MGQDGKDTEAEIDIDRKGSAGIDERGKVRRWVGRVMGRGRIEQNR